MGLPGTLILARNFHAQQRYVSKQVYRVATDGRAICKFPALMDGEALRFAIPSAEPMNGPFAI